MKKLATLLAGLILAAASAAMIAAAPAQADTWEDAQFLAQLADNGFQNIYGGAAIITQGHQTCARLDAVPTSWGAHVREAQLVHILNPALTLSGAQQFVAIAVVHYCPRNAPTWTAAEENSWDQRSTLA